MILAQLLQQIVDLLHHQLDAGVGPHAAVGAQEAGREIQADHAAGVADRGELPVGEIARRRAQRMGIGMGRHQRRLRQPRHIPKTLLGDVRQVDQNLQVIAGADQPLAGRGETVAEIRPGREVKRHAMAEDVGPAPHRPDRPQPRRIENVEESELGVDGLRAFQMDHHGQRLALNGGPDFGGGGADRHRACGSAFELQQDGQFGDDGIARLVHRQRLGERHGVASARHLSHESR
jgi:hypothetical protein